MLNQWNAENAVKLIPFICKGVLEKNEPFVFYDDIYSKAEIIDDNWYGG